MNVSQAVARRKSVRGFLDTPVDGERLRAILLAASRAPSGGNLQPWHIHVVTGGALGVLKEQMAARLAAGEVEAAHYNIYPPDLAHPYKARRFQLGMALYEAMGIAREDQEARNVEFRRNFTFFGAPAALFCTVDRGMGLPQWADLGMYLQNVMLLCTEAGFATCAQECWAMYPQTVGAFLALPPERMLFCGMAIGYEDATQPANRLRTGRATVDEWLSFKE